LERACNKQHYYRFARPFSDYRLVIGMVKMNKKIFIIINSKYRELLGYFPRREKIERIKNLEPTTRKKLKEILLIWLNSIPIISELTWIAIKKYWEKQIALDNID